MIVVVIKEQEGSEAASALHRVFGNITISCTVRKAELCTVAHVTADGSTRMELAKEHCDVICWRRHGAQVHRNREIFLHDEHLKTQSYCDVSILFFVTTIRAFFRARLLDSYITGNRATRDIRLSSQTAL